MKTLASVVLALILAVPASAHTASTSEPHPFGFPNLFERKEEMKQSLEERKDAMHTNIEERRDLIKTNVDERRDLIKTNIEERRALIASSTMERRELLKQSIEERRALFASTTARWKAAIAENIKEKVIARAEHAVELLNAMLERLNGISERIANRIAILADEGVDTSEAEAALERASTQIDEAEEAVETLGTQIAEALAGENPREALMALKEDVQATKLAIREAHEALKEAVKALPHREKDA